MTESLSRGRGVGVVEGVEGGGRWRGCEVEREGVERIVTPCKLNMLYYMYY